MEELSQNISFSDINTESRKSEIILFIAAHGADLQEELPLNLQTKPCLLFSLANKGSIAILPPQSRIGEIELDQEVIHKLLVEELRIKSKPVITVLNNLKEKLYNEFKYSDYCIRKFKTVNQLYNNPMNREKNKPTHKHMYETYKRLANDCENQYVGAMRVTKTDRLYDFSDETKNIVDIIDIRYPKKEYDINIIGESIQKVAFTQNGIEYLKLSDILNVLYDFGFDYVTIIDFACRVCQHDIDEHESIEEMRKGAELKEIYRELRLGGKKSKKNKYKSKKNKRVKRGKNKKSNTLKKYIKKIYKKNI